MQRESRQITLTLIDLYNLRDHRNWRKQLKKLEYFLWGKRAKLFTLSKMIIILFFQQRKVRLKCYQYPNYHATVLQIAEVSLFSLLLYNYDYQLHLCRAIYKFPTYLLFCIWFIANFLSNNNMTQIFSRIIVFFFSRVIENA